ncbi:chorion class B protein PC10 isoform X2 [Manduca sexta]|uniref:chorion class B protein PC10 isoform X2 n=1 Tax=Manduca sexta TaxID=7130 RepID=UPI00188FACA7|nr:chorion class B protein PC10 isoform X2 [Manduca sexta]
MEAKVISGQLLPSAEMIGPAIMPEMAITDTIIGPNIPHGPNVPYIPNMPLGPNIPLGPNLGLNNIANLGASNMALASNMAMGAPRAALGPVGPNWAGNLGLGISPASMAPPMGLAASYGGGFTVTSSSPIAPTGLTVTSENTIEGPLLVAGQLPFLGTVAVDGAYATTGMGSVTYGCGDGNIGMVNEGIPATPSAPVMAPGYNPAMSPGLNYNGLGGRMGLNGIGGYY